MKYVHLVDVLLARDVKGPSIGKFSFFFFYPSLTFFIATPVASPATPSTLHLSDSASQMSSGIRPPLPLPQPHPSKCPTYYPELVLWTFADSKSNPSVGMSPGNESRPPMACGIQHENRELISDDEWKTIHQLMITTMHSRLDSINTSHLPPSATNQSHKKTFYTHYFMKEWLAALAELEVIVPLLSLCSGDWKADKMLASVLDKSPNPGPPLCAPTPS